jgi:hypothetical protein
MATLRQIIASGFLFCVLSTGGALAAEITVQVNKISIDGIGTRIGTITLKDSNHGMIVAPGSVIYLPEATPFIFTKIRIVASV